MIDAGPRKRRLPDWLPALGAGEARGHGRRLAIFAVIGAICTVAFAALYALMRTAAGPLTSNFVALSLTMVFNFAANRRFTFEATSGALPVQGAQYGLVYLLGLGAATATLHASLQIVSEPGRALETLIAVGAGGVATIIRFALLSAWVFRRR